VASATRAWRNDHAVFGADRGAIGAIGHKKNHPWHAGGFHIKQRGERPAIVGAGADDFGSIQFNGHVEFWRGKARNQRAAIGINAHQIK
jgi:hypothetical protein